MAAEIGTDVERAARLLRSGGLVAFATETVYGLGANALDATAVARIFEAKQRPLYDPLICHVSEFDQVLVLAAEVTSCARSLMDRFWPGPLSLVLPRGPRVPDLVTAGLESVAVRMPRHPLALELIGLAGTPIAAPSANLFGQVSPTTAAHVAEQLADRVDYILDGGACSVGVESTVVQLIEGGDSDRPVLELLRPGGVTVEELQEVADVRVLEHAENPVLQGARAPGMLPRHYAPTTPLEIQQEIHSGLQHVLEGSRVGLLLPRPSDDRAMTDRDARIAAVEVLSATGDLRECAVNFFAALRRLDAMRLSRIIALPFPDAGLGLALNDRLRRAAQR